MSEHNSTASTAPVASGHSHGHSHAAPLLELNETLILLTHSPDPMSYWEFDQSEEGKPAVLYIHIVLMSFAFFGLLPLCKLRPFPLSSLGGGNDEVGRRRREEGGKALTRFFFLRSALPQGWWFLSFRHSSSRLPRHLDSRPHLRPGAFVFAFSLCSISPFLSLQVYNGLTPDLYSHSSHTSWGWLTMILSIALDIVDVARFLLLTTSASATSFASVTTTSTRRRRFRLARTMKRRRGKALRKTTASSPPQFRWTRLIRTSPTPSPTLPSVTPAARCPASPTLTPSSTRNLSNLSRSPFHVFVVSGV
jgi:hypothetical protein